MESSESFVYLVFARCKEEIVGRSGLGVELWGNSTIMNVAEEAETARGPSGAAELQGANRGMKHL